MSIELSDFWEPTDNKYTHIEKTREIDLNIKLDFDEGNKKKHEIVRTDDHFKNHQ